MAGRTRTQGFTLIEMMVVLGIIGAMTALAVPGFSTYFADQRVKQAARSVADVLSLARTEAIRTGRNHVVYFQQDPTGAVLKDGAGNIVPVLMVKDDDGTGPLPAPNGKVDVGEPSIPLRAETGVNWGVTFATGAAPGDTGLTANFGTGRTFKTKTAGAAASWIVFRPDGVPRGYSTGPYTEGDIGSGGGAVYLTNGRRDYAIVLAPLGGVRVDLWDRARGQWRN
jgi:prepilin-type N-terminal cleavage/methylation domain-containing protein